MLEKELDMVNIYASMQRAIDDEIEKNSKYADKYRGKLDDKNKKMGFFDRLSNKSSIKEYQQKITLLNELKQSLFHFHFQESDKYSFPAEVIEQFENLGSNLTQDEFTKLKESVNDCLKDVNRDRKDAIVKAGDNTLKILEKLGFTGRSFLVYRDPENKIRYIDSVSYKRALEVLQQETLKELTPNYVSLHAQQSSVDLAYGDKALSQDIDKLIQSGNYEATPSVTAIVKNYSEIKNMLLSKDKCETVLSQLSALKNMLVGITEVNVEGLTRYINQLETSYKKELEKANKYLEKFDFTDIKRQIEQQRKKEEQDRSSNINMSIYQGLAYDLAKVMAEHPEDYQTIKEIQDKMSEISRSSGLTDSQLFDAKTEGTDRYRNEKYTQKATAKGIKERKDLQDELYSQAMSGLREAAIRELESSGAFDEVNEFRNGDVYSKPIDKDSMIKKKMEELAKLANMTPEERYLQDLKERGVIGSDVNSLNRTQVNDARIGYGDSAYPWVKDFKTLKARDGEQANNYYREYIKYRIRLKDKSEHLSFIQFVEQIYGIRISELLVDDAVKEEMKEVSRGL